MKTPILISGAGPVGLAVAGDLGWRGVACVVVEKGDGTITQPKMDLIHPRTMEFCRRWGIVEQVEQSGYNRDYPQDYAWITALSGGWELGREPFPTPNEETPPPESPQRRERAPQNFFDPVIARFAKSFPHVTVRYRTELLDFADDGRRVTATVRDLDSGKTDTIECGYLVGADGGGSLVREKLGIGMSGKRVLTYTTNAIFRCANLDALHTTKPGYRFIFIGPEGTWCTIVAIDGRDHWRFSLVGDDQRRDVTEAEMRAAIQRAVGRKFDFEIESMVPWSRRELTADEFSKGRVFIVGDAAHQLSPTGAFGMNTGMQEAVDLGWKLAAVEQGWGGPKLLASYSQERQPIAARNVTEAGRNLKRMLSTRTEKPPKEIFEHGPAGDKARAEYGAHYTEVMSHEWFTLGVTLGYRYEGSPIIVPDGTPPPPDEARTYIPTARPGHRAPHVWLKDGRSTLDLFGRGFTLMRIGAAPPPADGFVAAAKKVGMPLTVEDVPDQAVADLYERKLVLVRPDGHVAWRGDAPPPDPARIIDTVRGA
jgi:2-polyprenyl-6-methoxyphenol hydroxylase-like FAD-dependent oxidoreductase